MQRSGAGLSALFEQPNHDIAIKLLVKHRQVRQVPGIGNKSVPATPVKRPAQQWKQGTDGLVSSLPRKASLQNAALQLGALLAANKVE